MDGVGKNQNTLSQEQLECLEKLAVSRAGKDGKQCCQSYMNLARTVKGIHKNPAAFKPENGRRLNMDTAHRRMEIISILSAKGHITSRELAWEFDVSSRTILHDIAVLSFDYPIYTKPGEGGGIFIMESYKPYINTPTETELELLCRFYRKQGVGTLRHDTVS